MRTNWKAGKEWSDRFTPEIKRILGEHLIGDAPITEDQKRNTDLIILRKSALRIACRVRRYQYLARYGNEFTIRAKLKSGTQTELAKIVAGWGDYLFYGFCDKTESFLTSWFIGSLPVFRSWFARQLHTADARVLPGTGQDNHDGETSFRAFDRGKLPPGFIVADYLFSEPQPEPIMKEVEAQGNFGF